MKTQVKEIPFARPIIGDQEKDAVQRILNGPILVHGPVVKEFEKNFAKYTGAAYAVSVSSCTAGLHLLYFHYGIKAGDEVIVPAQTHVATAHAVELCGAKPVFVDAELETGNIDIAQIENNINERTKAISIVHFLGMPVQMDRITAIAKKYNLRVIEDCALALGTRYKGIHAGLHGDAGSFSFYPVKHMTTAEGGMIITNNKELAEQLTRKKAFGVDRTASERSIPGVYDVTMLGFNYRMNEIEAAIGIEQIKRANSFLEAREQNYKALLSGLRSVSEISTLRSSGGEFKSSYYCLSVLLKDSIAEKRFEIVDALKKRGVGTSIYYPRPVPHMTYYRTKYNYSESSFPAASKISYGSIALPVGPHLDADDMEYIASSLKEAITEVKS